MATKVTILDPKYFSEIKNGSSFSLNTGDFSTHLLGGMTEQMLFQCRVRIQNKLVLQSFSVNNNVITSTGGQDFIAEDFYVGGTAIITFLAADDNFKFDIDSISSDGTIMTVSNVEKFNDLGASLGASSLPDGLFNVDSSSDRFMRDLSPSEGLRMKYNFIGNDDSITFLSPLDQIEQAFKFDGIRSAGGPVTGVWDSQIKGSKTGDAIIDFVGDVTDGGVTQASDSNKCPQDSIQEFTLDQDFIYGPYYIQGEQANAEGPFRPDRLLGQDLRHIIDFEFRSELSNPNNTKLGEWNTVKGRTNYFGENYIDQIQIYSIDSLQITDLDTGLPIEELSLSTQNRVVFSVLNSGNTFADTHPIVSFHSGLPTSNNYTNQFTEFKDIWNYETLRTTIQPVPVDVDGTIITNFTAELVDPGRIDVSYDIDGTLLNGLSEGDRYIHGVIVGDNTLTTVFSNKTPLKAQVAQYVENTDVPDLVTFEQTRFLRHVDNDADPDLFSELKGWIQDPFRYKWEFNLDVGTKGAVLESLNVRLVALRTVDNQFFELDSVTYDLSGQVVTPGTPNIQQIEINETRGFPLADGDPNNEVSMTTGAYGAPFQTYSGLTAFLIPWQEWQALESADTIFYDPAEPNDGLNKKTSRYSGVNGYEIHMILDLEISQNLEGVDPSNKTRYIDKSSPMTVLDYGEQDGSPVNWTWTTQTFDITGNDTNGVILKNEDTIGKAVFIPDIPFGPDPVDYYAWGGIEEVNNPGKIDQKLSSFRDPATGIILIGPVGLTYTRIQVVADNIEVDFQVDHTKLDPAKDYNVTWKFGLLDGTIPAIPETFKDVMLEFKLPHQDSVYGQQIEQMFLAELILPYFENFDIDTDVTYRTQPGADPGPTGWGPADDIVPNTFAQFATDLAANSSLWYQIVIDNPPADPGIFGAILRYKVLVNLDETQTLTLDWTGNEVDRQIGFLFDTRVEFTNPAVSTLVFEKFRYTLKEAPVTLTDYLFHEYKDTATAFDNLAALNAGIAALSDGDKYYVGFYPTWNNTQVVNRTCTVDVTFLDDDKQLIAANAGAPILLNYITNPKARPFGDSWQSANGQYVQASLAGSAFNQYLDNALAANPWTVEMWVKDRRLMFCSNADRSGGNIQCGLLIDTFTTSIRVLFGDDRGATSDYIQCQFLIDNIAAEYTHLIITYDGSRTAAGMNGYINGKKCILGVDKQVDSDTLTPTAQSGGLDLVGNPLDFNIGADSRVAPPLVYNGVTLFERCTFYSAALTDAQSMERYLDPAAVTPNVLRNWDFNQVIGTTVTETVAADNGTILGTVAPTITPFTP